MKVITRAVSSTLLACGAVPSIPISGPGADERTPATTPDDLRAGIQDAR